MFQSLGSPDATMIDHSQLSDKNSCKSLGIGRNLSAGNGTNVVPNLFRREVHGALLQRLNNPFGENGTPHRLRMKVDDVIPASAMEAGNIFMGFTNCGRYMLSYTCRPSEHFGASIFYAEASYMYTLHIWLFTPYSKLRKVSQVSLFDNNGVYDNNLLIEISQWHMDDNHILITGHSANPDSEGHYTFYTTITTLPETRNCWNCIYMHDDELEEDHGTRLRANCILHGLTLHMKYDHCPPYPKLNPDVQLRFKNTVILNTGNVIHMVSFKLIRPSHSKLENSLLPTAGLPANKATKVPLLCDLWLKIPNANIGALASVKLCRGRPNVDDEQNIISLNNMDKLLSMFPNSSPSKPEIGSNNSCCAVAGSSVSATHHAGAIPQRRLSQSSTESEFSIFSPKSVFYCDSDAPMSPPFLNKPRSPRQAQISADIKNLQSKQLTTSSPSKLMLPPQERKFFKRRLSSNSLGMGGCSSSCNANNTISNQRPNSSPIKNVEVSTNTDSTSDNQQDQSAFDVFEIQFEDTSNEKHLSSFKTFRKRRLADKKYEFNDADISAENIVPLKMTRRKSNRHSQIQGSSSINPRSPRSENTTTGNESPRGSYPDMSRSPRAYHFISPIMSPNYEYSSVSDVLRPINNNSKVKVSALSPNNHQTAVVPDTDIYKQKEEDFDKDFKEFSSQSIAEMKKIDTIDIPSHPHAKATISVHVNCIAKVLRSYIQKDDDNMSVITDVEDELYQGYPFPVALPLDVHGAGYQQLQMISNSKADRFLPVPVVQVLQQTLDIEMLCNEVANLICMASDKHYCSCLDFDLTFANAEPDRDSITAIVVMVVQAKPMKSRNRTEKDKCNPNPRKKYETFFACEWIPSQEYCRILYKSTLRELEVIPDPWHPTEDMEAAIKSYLGVSQHKKTLTNELAVHDWQSLDELVDAAGIVTLFKEEDPARLTETDRRLEFERNIDIASLASTTTDSEED